MYSMHKYMPRRPMLLKKRLMWTERKDPLKITLPLKVFLSYIYKAFLIPHWIIVLFLDHITSVEIFKTVESLR